MNIKYIPIYTDDVEKQLRFFTEKLGLETCGCKNILFGQECTIIKTNNPGVFLMVIKQAKTNTATPPIILSTDDCLNDYYSLKTAGVSFYNEPEYLPIGLGAEFSDPTGNRYLLIEERIYS
jgi:predicted enzyme related to lactoylglutathione lyase